MRERQIKYRAFIDGKFYYFDMQSLVCSLTPGYADLIPEMKKLAKVHAWILEGNFADASTDRFDKNRKEIYEGDIVKFSNWKPKEVIWNETGVACYAFKESRCFLADYDTEKMEVVGNIYENQDLLEPKDV